MLPTLSAFIDVANIPKKYGGELDFECGMKPVLDSAILSVLELEPVNVGSAETTFLTAPVRWIDGENGDLIALGVGSENGKERRQVIGTLRSEVAKHAFPGMSRQNTKNSYPSISRQNTAQQLKPLPQENPPPLATPLVNGAGPPPQPANPHVSIPPTVESTDLKFATSATSPSQIR